RRISRRWVAALIGTLGCRTQLGSDGRPALLPRPGTSRARSAAITPARRAAPNAPPPISRTRATTLAPRWPAISRTFLAISTSLFSFASARPEEWVPRAGSRSPDNPDHQADCSLPCLAAHPVQELS